MKYQLTYKFICKITAALAAILISGILHAQQLTVKSGNSIQDVVNRAQAGDTILVEPGYYHQSVYIDKEDITIRGLQKDGKFAELNGELKLNDGIIASGHGITIDGFLVKAYKGNGIMTQGANNFKIINNHVHGAFYSIFPQYGKNGLIKGNTITGAEDAGVYVGMCDNVDIIDNIAHGNVMGLEFENTRNAMMANNEVYNNSAGITLTLIPGLPVKDAMNIVIRDNNIYNNNLENFAPASSIAATVPSGIGLAIVAVDNVLIHNNVIKDNTNAGLFVVDMASFGLGGDSKTDPYSDNLKIFENTWDNNGNGLHGVLGDMISMAGKTGIEILSTGKDRNTCSIMQEGVDVLGDVNWKKCSANMPQENYQTAMLSEPAEAPKYTKEQKGRLTYLAVCTGCHTYNTVLHGPSIQSIQALYGKDIKALKEYITKPVRKREDFPEMPEQDYLGEETLEAISKYILFDLEQ